MMLFVQNNLEAVKSKRQPLIKKPGVKAVFEYELVNHGMFLSFTIP